MKIQCACGAKYAFDVTPEQAQQPVRFVCPSCGLDSSEYVNNLIRQQFGVASSAPGAAPATEIAPPPPGAVLASSAAGAAPPSPPAPTMAAPPPPPPPAAVPRMRLNTGGAAKAAEEPVEEIGIRMCAKHAKVEATDECMVCHKPICPQCMELFGYVCSPLCRQKADLKGIRVPVFAGQKSVREARMWLKVGWIAGTAAALVVGFFGFMIWYRLFGSAPSVQFAVRFEQPALSGASYLCGPENSQVVFLHGGKLARHDVKEKKEIWSANLVDSKEIDQEVQAELKRLQEFRAKQDLTEPDSRPIHIPPPEELAKDFARSAADELELRVVGQNIWVANSKRVVRYDWETGKPGTELPVQGGFGGLIERGEELLRLDRQRDKDVITRINLASGKVQEEQIVQPMAAKAAEARKNTLAGAATGRKTTGGRGLPVGTPGRNSGQPLDARKVEQQASQLSLPAQIALPAVLSVNRAQERTLAEMEGEWGSLDPYDLDNGSGEYFTLIPAKDGYVQFSTRLIEKKLVEKVAMKAPPAKSALDGPINASATMDIANEILNDMQRDLGGAVELVDESRYQVTVRRADGKEAAEWTSEVVGRPSVFPLNSVNVVAANQKIIVLDKGNKKLWESALTYNVEADAREGDPETTGQGPCVERGNTLFVFDEGVLTAFDLKTGNAQWRLPSVGISGLFFDHEGMM
jgi:hypothetical protein